jgi:hypothetical protein
MQTHMAEGPSSINILKKPGHILSFIKHVFDTTQGSLLPANKTRSTTQGGLGIADLRIVDEDNSDDELFIDGDSDDEDDGDITSAEILPPDDEMTTTAINLLLSILEGRLYISSLSSSTSYTTVQQTPSYPHKRRPFYRTF